MSLIYTCLASIRYTNNALSQRTCMRTRLYKLRIT